MTSETSKGSSKPGANVGHDGPEVAVGEATSTVADATEDRSSGFTDTAATIYGRGAERVRGALDELPASMSDTAAAAEHLALRGRQQLGHRVRKQPIEALLLAGAIGYLVGWASIR